MYNFAVELYLKRKISQPTLGVAKEAANLSEGITKIERNAISTLFKTNKEVGGETKKSVTLMQCRKNFDFDFSSQVENILTYKL